MDIRITTTGDGGPFKRLLDCGVWPCLVQVIQTCDPTDAIISRLLCKTLQQVRLQVDNIVYYSSGNLLFHWYHCYLSLCENIQIQRLKIILTRALQYVTISAKVLEDSEDRGLNGTSGLQRSDLMRCPLL